MGQLYLEMPLFSLLSLWKEDCLCTSVLFRFATSFVFFLPCIALALQSSGTPIIATSTTALSSAYGPVVDSPSDDAPSPLTLEEALSLAEKNSPRLHAALSRSARAAAAIQTAKAYTNPQVEFSAGHQSSRDVAVPGLPGDLQRYAVYQTMEIPSERNARQRVARLASTSSDYSLAGERLSVVANVKHAFYEVLRRKEEIVHAQQNLSLVEDLRRRVEVEVGVGEKGRLELTRAEAELARARFMLRSAQIRLADSIAALRVAIAAPADKKFDPQGILEPAIQLQPLPELQEAVLRNHPVIEQSRTDVLQAQATLKHQRTLRFPQPTFVAEYEPQPDVAFWRVGVTVSLPIWNRRRGQIQEASAAIRESTATRDQRQLEILSALERAYAQYQLADQQVTALQAGSLHEAESAVEAAQSAYHFGERGIVEVLDAQRVLQSVRGDLLDAQFARQSALIDLEELGAITPGGRP
jgi:outer membrane protein, heavy metal efflux system